MREWSDRGGQEREEAEEGRALSFDLGFLFANRLKDFFPSSAISSFFFPPRPDRDSSGS